MEWLLQNITSVLFAAIFFAIFGGWVVIRGLPILLTGKRRTAGKAVPWRFSLATWLLVTTAAAIAMGCFRTAPIIGGVVGFSIVCCGLCAGGFLQMRRELVRRREKEVRSLLENARRRERSEAERDSPGAKDESVATD